RAGEDVHRLAPTPGGAVGLPRARGEGRPLPDGFQPDEAAGLREARDPALRRPLRRVARSGGPRAALVGAPEGDRPRQGLRLRPALARSCVVRTRPGARPGTLRSLTC